VGLCSTPTRWDHRTELPIVLSDGQHSGSEEDDDEDDGISVKIGKISYLPRALRHPLSAPVGNKPQRPPEGGEVKVDEDGAPLVDGKRIYDTDLGKLLSTPRPWTTPGINISDYFNYGFNEGRKEASLSRQSPQSLASPFLNHPFQSHGMSTASGMPSTGRSSAPSTTRRPPARYWTASRGGRRADLLTRDLRRFESSAWMWPRW
jgi:hypothetical protein